MKPIKGAAILGQSGGPTSVINASAAGVFLEALKNPNITRVYAAAHGIQGILKEKIYDINQEDIQELELLTYTPSSSIGSVRYKLKDREQDDSEYQRILEVFKKYNIRYFFYNGGNDSMDTCNKISKFFKDHSYECYCIGIPKTIDNDLAITDHTPGYASAAKFVATGIMEVICDATVYDSPMITIIEIMGRNAGWLAAAAKLSQWKGTGPDLIYLPELVFDLEKFYSDVKKKYKEKHGKVIVAVSEGIKTSDGKYVSEYGKNVGVDAFGHKQMGGTAYVLASLLSSEISCKIRPVEFSLLQRSAQHLASAIDVAEAKEAGRTAVSFATNGITDVMVGFKRVMLDGAYSSEIIQIPLEIAANQEKKFPLEWIIENGTGISDDFISYLLPLIQGEHKPPLEDGLPRFAHLKKILA